MMATVKQIEYVQALQDKYYKNEFPEDSLSDDQIRTLDNYEVNEVLSELHSKIAYEEMVEECCKAGFPNQ